MGASGQLRSGAWGSRQNSGTACQQYQRGVSDDRKAANVKFAFLFIIQAADTIAFAIIAASDAETTALIVAVTGKAPNQIATFSPGC